MRTISTEHVLHLSSAVNEILGDAINLEYLLQCLELSYQNAPVSKANGGKKRVLSTHESEPPAKRSRDSSPAASSIPIVPVYRHIATVSLEDPTDAQVAPLTELTRWITEHQEFLGVFKLEKCTLKTVNGRTWIHRASGEQFMVLPAWSHMAESSHRDFKGEADFFNACAYFEEIRRLFLDVSFRIQVRPELERNLTMPFELVIEVVVKLLPAIADPPPPTVKGRNRVRIEDTQQALVRQFFYDTSRSSDSVDDVGIPFFLSSLRAPPEVTSHIVMDSLQPLAMEPTLLPFQRRSLAWLLRQEGKCVSENGAVVSVEAHDELPLYWERVQAVDVEFFANIVTGQISFERPPHKVIHGGILAEEPGLGKTLESLGLILLNPATTMTPPAKHHDFSVSLEVAEIKTSLIVTPSTLATQWADEIRLHVPSLRVLVYEGWQKVGVPITEAEMQKALDATSTAARKGKSAILESNGKSKNDANMDVDSDISNFNSTSAEPTDWCSYINTFDVCITTYDVLRSDLNVARAPIKRPRRESATYSEYERPRSPLIMVEWHRVVMDEVQMVGGGKTEEMVSLLPRRSSFAVSGTPARAKVADIVHVLRFLRIEDVLGPRVWNRLQQAAYAPQFKELFRRYGIRTKRDDIASELTIPPQTRYLVPIELGKVERQVYDQVFERALGFLGFDVHGMPNRDDWQLNVPLLRSSLRTLRGIATHPQVGQFQNQADKLLAKPGVLKTIGEVLDDMRDQNWRATCDDRKKRVQSWIRLAQLLLHDENNGERYAHALAYLARAEAEARMLLADVHSALVAHDTQGEILKEEAASTTRHVASGSGPSELHNGEDHGGNREFLSEALSGSINDDRGGLPKTLAGDAHWMKRGALSNRLRDSQLLMHQVRFWQGNVAHNQSPEKVTELERSAYAAAEALRKELLKASEQSVSRAIDQIKADLAERTSDLQVHEEDLLIPTPFCNAGGIRSAGIFEEVNQFIEGLLNPQSALIWEWRTILIDLLTRPLTIQDEEDVTGDEYNQNLQVQSKANAYIQAYASLLADRREALTSERTTLAAVESRETHARKTKAAMLATFENPELNDEINTDIELPDIDDESLANNLNDQRRSLVRGFEGRAIRSFIAELNGVLSRILNDQDAERSIIKDAVQDFRRILSSQNHVHKNLDLDLSHIRKAFNARIVYFAQLQEISNTVIDAEWRGHVTEAIESAREEEKVLTEKINTGKARQRYLDNLTKEQQVGGAEDDGTCILCRSEFSTGYLTNCGHMFCEDCTKEWVSHRRSKVCPVCRAPVDIKQLQQFTSGLDEPVSFKLITEKESSSENRQKIDYNLINADVLNHIQSIPSNGSYGSKIQTMIQHLLYIQEIDPGAKSIVFSAWADSLLIVQHALTRNGIASIRIDQSRNKQHAATQFRTDPDVLVLLLHGERENAGLNVTCASRIFLLESVVNHAFEVQAIARIDRMGQRNETEVFCYYAEDTVERGILDLAAQSGLSLYVKGNATGTINTAKFSQLAYTDSPSKQLPKKQKQKGDYIFSTEDMLAILFPNLYQDVTIQSNDRDLTNDTNVHSNAIAGPSGLPL